MLNRFLDNRFKRIMVKRVLLIAALLLSTSGWASTHIPWSNGSPYFITTRGAKVAEVLKGIGANYGVPIIVSPEVTDSFVGTIRDAVPDEIIARFAQLFSLATYYDGQALYVYKMQEVRSQIITPRYLTTGKLVDYLTRNQAAKQQFCSLRSVSNFNALEVFGVPACIERVSALAKNLDEKILNQAKVQETVQVFPLRFASANDNVYTLRNQQVRVPGMASVLREMVQNRSITGENVPVTNAPGNNPTTSTALPTFAADSQQNAVIVRDREVNMPIYASLIKKLDLRPTQIQISVAIIDVNATDVDTLGVNWEGSVHFGKAGIGFNSTDLSGQFGGGINTVLNDPNHFMMQISALEQHSKAKILSRPSIVTLNNVQAVLDRNITFRTKVQSERSANLADFSTGSLLRVTPRLIKNVDGQDQIILILNIQDGRQGKAIGGTEVLPSISTSEISTQAILRSGQSLLLGGFVQDQQQQGVQKIPMFGNLPILGGLFRSKNNKSERVIRLFMIKAEPRAID